ncbi:PepSY domain-containing protein [Xanthomonas sp. NCPPB 2654]|uniref:PepSY-associated TM helix domain-containing protein n=1 Tax=unclassified Xanthomonas TaxID=2643310 RepID=UPI0021E0CCB7|nr:MULTISPECIES: PepSY domain-containing protein [unclassified Xanthomonas]MDL5366753.1 PepSY domain-containing protein [Xanthomonas sp. NCPPB 2654]UYC19745.1 PepSY domain-containing protein [Xanthomonas sp. CFBP 8443]
MATPMAAPNPTAAAPARFYRAVWRWHFYAGLLVLPLLAWLALTGAAFVYQQPIDGYFHRALKTVQVPAQARAVAPQRLLDAALAAQPGQALRYTTPLRRDASAEVTVGTADGRRLVVYVDPYRARVLGSLPEHGTVAWTIRRLHSLALVGPWASALIEVAAGWAILLVLTGVYLWWPRGRRGGVTTVRGRPPQRVFWRDTHALTGSVVGAMLLFLALTGMPWSWFWGAQVNRLANGHHYGYPAGLRVDLPMSTQRLSDAEVPAWSLRQARLPQSQLPQAASMPMPATADARSASNIGDNGNGSHAEHAENAEHAAHGAMAMDAMDAMALQPGAIGLDAAVAQFQARGIAAGYGVALPRGARGVYTASVYPPELAQQRVIHLDQYSGKVLLDMRYADYGPLAKALEWGINVHLGQQYGTFNQLLLIVSCIGILLLCGSAALMWWKRRPAGGLGVPPLPADQRTLRGVLALLAIGGVLFPLVGVSLVLMLALDWLLVLRRE